MNMIKRLMALVMALLMCAAVACAEPSADDVMVTVNGTAVTRSQYEDYLSTLTNYYAASYDVSDPTMQAMIQQFALQTGIEYAVMSQKVTELGLDLTEEEKTAATDSALAQWEAVIGDGLTYYGLTDESTEEEYAELLIQVLAELDSMGYSEESFLSEALMYASYDKLFNHITKDVAVTDDDVVAHFNNLVENDKALYENDAAAYEELQQYNQLYLMYGMTDYVTEAYYKPNGYRQVTHILLSADEALLTAYADLQAKYEEQQNTIEEGGEVTEELVTADEVENARLAILAAVQPTVDEINQKLADGATFAELIPQYTTDPGMSDAASIAAGYEVHMDSTNWVIPFRDQSFTVSNIGDVTAPVVTDYGVHIIQYVGDVAGGPVELTDDLRAAFQADLLATATSDAYNNAIAQWVSEAKVEYSAEAKTILGITE